MTEGAGSLDAVGASAPWRGELAGTVCVQNTLVRIRPRPNVDPGFLAWWAEHAYTSRAFASFATGANIFHLGAEGVRGMPFPGVALDDQKRIANFLGAETATIDSLVQAKRRQVAVLEERSGSMKAEWYHAAGQGRMVSLRRLGGRVEQGWSPQCESGPALSSEWGVLKTSAVSSGQFSPAANKKLPDGVAPDLRWQVRSKDLLVVRGSGSIGSVGMCAVAEPGDRLLTISDLVYRVRGLPGFPGFYASALTSRQVRQTIESTLRTDAGQTLKLRSDDVLDLRVPLVLPGAQSASWHAIECTLLPIRETAQCLQAQIRLLADRRRALIAAAVTGKRKVA